MRIGDWSSDVCSSDLAARYCAIMLMAQISEALDGDLDRVKRILKLGAFVASAPSFTDQPKVANGRSDVMVGVFGDAGRRPRSAVGLSCFLFNDRAEVDAIICGPRGSSTGWQPGDGV